jgi:uncharacterized protein YqgV (UPF0045/DUF77 family)
MRVQGEVSLYPLRTATLMDFIHPFVGHLRRRGLSVEVGPMSSCVRGECRDLFHALGEAFQAAARQCDVVVTVKVSNACPETDAPMPEEREAHSGAPSGGT